MNSIKRIDSTTSTNDELKSMGINSLPNYFMLISDFQTAGRGRKKNIWESEKGKNLLSSILLFSAIPVKLQYDISCLISLAVMRVLTNHCKINNVYIKWPNDIYVKDKKIAGILVEHCINGQNIKYSIIGLGLNINQKIFSSHIPNPTSIILECKKEFDIEDIATNIVQQLQQLCQLSHNELRAQIHQSLYKKDTLNRFELCKNGEIFSGYIRQIDDNGCLIIETSNRQLYKFELNEIKYLQ